MSEEERAKPELKVVEVPGANVIDLAARKSPPPSSESVRVPGAHINVAEVRTEVVQLIACSNCHSPSFKLTHDYRVICAVCSIQIMSLRWHDVNVATVVPKSPNDCA